MAKEVKRFMTEGVSMLSDNEIREICRGKIGILYGFNNYENNLKHINDLKECILQEYPDKKDEDIEVWYIKDTQSICHANFTMLNIKIPTEDFIKLRAEGQIYIL